MSDRTPAYLTDDDARLREIISLRERGHTMAEIGRTVRLSPFKVSVLLWSHRMDLVHAPVEKARGTARGGESWGKGGLV